MLSFGLQRALELPALWNDVHGDDHLGSHAAHHVGGKVVPIPRHLLGGGLPAGKGRRRPAGRSWPAVPPPPNRSSGSPPLHSPGQRHQRQRDPQLIEGHIPQLCGQVALNPLAFEKAGLGERGTVHKLDHVPQPAYAQDLLFHEFGAKSCSVASGHDPSHAGAGQEIHRDALSFQDL